MSFDKQNFARTIQEQQAGISPQMWPIKLVPGALSLNSPFEVEINPCDCIWLPITYDKSYGTNPLQTPGGIMPYAPDSNVFGWNVVDAFDPASPDGSGIAPNLHTAAPIFGLRFNSPNNPWLLWSLSTGMVSWRWGFEPSPALQTWQPAGSSTFMRSISGPISRMWCQFYSWTMNGGIVAPQGTQVILMSMLGFSQQSVERRQTQFSTNSGGSRPDPESVNIIGCGGYKTSDLNSADLRVLGQNPMPAAPTTSGKGSTTG